MPSLKEIKTRIHSVKSSRKITSAMMMIASSKLVRMQKTISGLYPYEQKMSHLMSLLIDDTNNFVSPLSEKRAVKNVSVVIFSPNTGLIGKFNADLINQLRNVIADYKKVGVSDFRIYAIGNKVREGAQKLGFEQLKDYKDIADKPNYSASERLAQQLLDSFLKGETDEVILIYHHFKNKSVQELVTEVFLPLTLSAHSKKNTDNQTDYIFEPNREKIIETLIPKTLKLKLFTAHVDAVASEHAARTLAMQTAVDNADELMDELTLQYNKLRQQSITNELLDIIGGSFGR